MEVELAVLQTVKKHYKQTDDYRAIGRAKKVSEDEGKNSRYIARLLRKVKSRTKVRFFDVKDAIPIIGFFGTFKLAFDKNRIHKDAAMGVLPTYVIEMLANELNSHLCADDKSFLIAISVCYNDARSQKLLSSYAKVNNYLLGKFTTDQGIAKFDAAIHCYITLSTSPFCNISTSLSLNLVRWLMYMTTEREMTFSSIEKMPLCVTVCVNTGHRTDQRT